MKTLPLLSLVTPDKLAILATRSNYRFGQEIARDGSVTVTDANTFNLKATVKYKNGAAETTLLQTTSKGLRWKCSCTGRKDLFCKHCVAAALVAGEKTG